MKIKPGSDHEEWLSFRVSLSTAIISATMPLLFSGFTSIWFARFDVSSWVLPHLHTVGQPPCLYLLLKWAWSWMSSPGQTGSS